MTERKYRKIDLNQYRPLDDELDLLNDAGADGWELVAIASKVPIESCSRTQPIGRRSP